MPEVIHSITPSAEAVAAGLRSLQTVYPDARENSERALAVAYRELGVQHAVTRMLAEAESFDQVAEPLLRAVGEGLDWDVGAIWLAGETGSCLGVAAVWARPLELVAGFVQSTRVAEWPSNADTPAWIEIEFPSFLQARLELGRAAGLPSIRAALIRDSSGSTGIIEFFSSGEGQGPQSSHSLADVGWLIGQFLRRKRAEEAFRHGEVQYRHLFENMPVGLYRLGPRGDLLMANPWLVRLLGFESADAVARAEVERRVLGGPRREATLTQLANDGEVRGLESDWLLGSTVLHIRENIKTVRDTSGNVLCFEGAVEDITEQKNAEAELYRHTRWLEEARQTLELQSVEISRARDAALEASRLKSQFLANVSHEIRTPMNGVLGMTELALATAVSAEQGEYLTMVRTSAHALMKLINDLLDFSKIEAGRLELDVAPFAFRASLSEWLKPMKHAAIVASVDFDWAVAPELPDDLVGDAGRLRQVIVNLAGNALKFTDAGSIAILVNGSVPAGSQALRLRFAVSDSGIGIPRDKLRSIFEPFIQADGSSTRRHGGTGLGLAICEQLLKLMGGRIWVDSEPGVGSTFFFEADVSIASERAQLPTPPAPAPGPITPAATRRILLAEDDAVSRRLAVRLLERQGHTVNSVDSGRAALDWLAAQSCDIVLLDLGMPELGGLDTAAVIRAREQDGGPRLPLIALTASAGESDRTECLAAGFDMVVTKPIRPSELAAAITLFS